MYDIFSQHQYIINWKKKSNVLVLRMCQVNVGRILMVHEYSKMSNFCWLWRKHGSASP